MPLPLNPSPPEIQFPSNKRQRGFSDLAETRIVAGIALVLLVVTTAWLWNRYVAFRPDKEGDYGSKTGVLASAQEHIQPGNVPSGYLDIFIENSEVHYRVPTDGYLDHFRRDIFFKESSVGEFVVLTALASELENPRILGADKIVFVRGVRIGSRIYCSVQDHVERQKKDNRWLLWFGLFPSLATGIVFAGMFLREEKQVVSQGAHRFLPLSFLGRGRDVFNPNGLIAIVSVVSMIGIPVGQVFMTRWIARNTQTRGGKAFTFVGSIGVAYGIAGLSVAAQMVQKFAPWDRLYTIFTSSSLVWIAVGLATIFCYALAGAVQFLGFRYFSENIRSSDGKRLGSVVRFFPFVGFQLLGLFSLLTVVGWAWLTVWYTRWIAKQLIAPGVDIRFVGSGFQLLWRTVAACVASVPLLTIPWTISWFLRWYITSFEISQTESPPSAVASTEV